LHRRPASTPRANQLGGTPPVTREDTAYPADPDSDYGFEKLYGERPCLAAQRNRRLDVRIARYHNIFGPEGAWRGGREKVPAALCRKVAEAEEGSSLEIWGDGRQTRSFLFIEECLEGTRRLMQSDFTGPVNIGSSESVTIDQLARTIMAIAGKRLTIVHAAGPQGVRARVSDNNLVQEKLGWTPSRPLAHGLAATYDWIAGQVAATAGSEPVGDA
jgi:GDP-D-mannose 3',5'-epimerase